MCAAEKGQLDVVQEFLKHIISKLQSTPHFHDMYVFVRLHLHIIFTFTFTLNNTYFTFI